jgi:osmotically-inducible protein OsmY
MAALSVALAASATACRSGSSRSVAGLREEPETARAVGPEASGTATLRGGAASSDPEIASAVLHELSEDPALRAAEVHVKSTDGIVEITGKTDNLLAKELATRHAEVVRGVRAVTNRMVVETVRVPNDELARTVRAALQGDQASTVTNLDVSAKDGAVTLKGNVDSFQQRLLAERIAKRLRGVADVANLLDVRLKHRRSDQEIARDVEARLRWDVLVDHALIGVSVDAGRVRLSGVVGSAAEKSQGEYDAWVSGVKDVDASRLTVNPLVGDDDVRREKYVITSDAEVARALRDALYHDPRVSTLLVQANASGGVATLTGRVPTVATRNAAEEIARHTVGVHHVNNRLQVKAPKSIADVDLQKRVEAALRVNPFTDEFEIATQADHGKVTLTGTVDSNFEKAEAESVAGHVVGVYDVDNRLVVERPRKPFVRDPYASPYQPEIGARSFTSPRPTKPDRDIERDITRELYWSPFLRDDRIEVSVRNGKATLTGAVDTLREKAAATENALQAGAVVVDNQLAVPTK